MATIILRPVSDISLGHTCSSGSSGYALINESTADDASTYIYQSISSTSSSSRTSSFKISGSSSKKIKITSAKVVVRACHNTSNSSDTRSLSFKLGIGGKTSSAKTVTLGTSFANTTQTYTASDLGIANTVYDSFDAANINISLTSSGALDRSKNSSFQIRITQVYVEITYDEIVDTGTGLYIKNNNQYSEVKAVYKKINGTYVKQTNISSLFNSSTKYKKG